MLTPEQFRRVRDLFDQALEAEPADVRAWLEARAADDPAVLHEAATLLKVHSLAGSFLSAGVTERVPDLLDEDEPLEPGTTIGIFVIECEVGRGGMARVYRAKDQRLGRTVAVKALAPRLLRDQSQRERLRREARAAAALKHPGICTVYSLEEVNDNLYIVSEFLEGRTLRDEIAHGPRPSARQVLETARELAGALASAHAKGITHRDFKPENVMRTSDGRLKVLDFGLARFEHALEAAGAQVTQPGTIIGTPEYMAPEQLNGGPVDPRTDVFAFGVLISEYASGVHPFAASTSMGVAARILEGQPASLGVSAPGLAPGLVSVVQRALEKSPAARFSSAAEIVAALARESPAPSPPGEVAAWWRLHQVAVIALYLVASILGWQIKEWLHGSADLIFLVLGVSASVAGVFRGFLLFTERFNREAFERERNRVHPVTLVIDLMIAFLVGIDGVILSGTRPLPAVLTLALAAGIAVARLVLEPSTTSGAFRTSSERRP